jgi:glycosyltransferase involved in cell wall biosynthesis
MTDRRMIFFTTRPIHEGPPSGARVRPTAMLAAFRAIGYEVAEVTGGMAERMKIIQATKAAIAGGTKFDFLYMENATLPLHMTEPKLALPRRHPFADAALLRFCRAHGIPVGIFNNDVHWRFASYQAGNSSLRRRVRIPFYLLEYWLYGRLSDVIFVPHQSMAAHLPGRFRRVEVLPHGADPGAAASPPQPSPSDHLNLFYVGGLGPFYRLHTLFAAVQRLEPITLTVCCRREEWQRQAAGYAPLMCERIRVVHGAGAELRPYIERADVLSCFLSPDPYWRATFPLKVFEYLAHARPILAAQDTNAGDFVLENGFGWTSPDDVEQLVEILQRIAAHPDERARMAEHIQRMLPQHTWQARARQAADSLTRASPLRLSA